MKMFHAVLYLGHLNPLNVADQYRRGEGGGPKN
jgi:hypothetical protein